jgi:hypothetical protein
MSDQLPLSVLTDLWRADRRLQRAGANMGDRRQTQIDHISDSIRGFFGKEVDCDGCECSTPQRLTRKYATRQGSIRFCPDCRKEYFNHKAIDLTLGQRTVRLTTNAWGRFASVQWFSGSAVGWDVLKKDKDFMRAAYNRLFNTYGPE